MSVPVSPAAAARELTRNAPPRSDHGLQEGCDIPQYGGLPVGKQHSAANPGPVREHLTSLVGSQQSLFLERRKCCGSPTKPPSAFLVGLRKSSKRRSQNPEDAAAQRHGQWPPPNGGPPRAWQCHNDMWDNHTAASAAVPTPGNINVNLGVFARRFSTVTDRFPGLGAGFLNLAGKTEGTAKKRGKNGGKWARNGLKRVGVS